MHNISTKIQHKVRITIVHIIGYSKFPYFKENFWREKFDETKLVTRTENLMCNCMEKGEFMFLLSFYFQKLPQCIVRQNVIRILDFLQTQNRAFRIINVPFLPVDFPREKYPSISLFSQNEMLTPCTLFIFFSHCIVNTKVPFRGVPLKDWSFQNRNSHDKMVLDTNDR